MRILCIHLPNWPIQRLLAADRGLDPGRPTILHARDSRRGQLVTACNAVAWKQGVRPAMPLTEATSLGGQREERQIVPSNGAADLAALARLAEHCERFTPVVGWETIAAIPAVPDFLFLDITGTAVLFGGETSLAQEVLSDLARLGYDARVAIADTVGEAWARCNTGDGQDPPVSALRVPAETVELLAQLGITRIAELQSLPRPGLRARFGDRLLLRLDQFLGTAPETIVAHRPLPEFIARRVLEYPTESRELIEKIVLELVQRLSAALAEKRQGAMQLSCRLEAMPPLVLRVGLLRPSANPRHLWDLLRIQLEQPLRSPVDRLTLAAPLTAPLENRQQELFGDNRHEADKQLESLIDRLSSRLGAEAVLRPQLTADPVPERAVAYIPLLQAGKRKPQAPPAHRPLVLHSSPVALTAISVVPAGPPVSFHFGGQQNKVAFWWGPERIESGWWRGRSARRDYYRVETESGQRYWLFRRLTDGQWFLHGEFA